MKRTFTLTSWLRLLLTAAALGISAYVAALVRTTQPSFTMAGLPFEFLLASITAGPIAVIASIGYKAARFTGVVAAIVLSGVLAAEIWAGVEEFHFRSQYQTVASGPKARLLFSDSWLSYDPVTRMLHGGD